MSRTLQKDSKIFLAGHRGMVGNSILNLLESRGYNNILTASRAELDLLDQNRTEEYIKEKKPDIVIIAAAKVGGIHANSTYPAEFIYENLQIATNLIHSSYVNGVERLLFLGSSCIYPKEPPIPIKEEYLLRGYLEKTNDAYAIAKIAGLKMCEAYSKQYGVLYHSLMPTNLYGPKDNYHPENSHVVGSFIRKFHEAKVKGEKEVIIWGTGTPKREFLYSTDLALACLHLLKLEEVPYLLNVGYGKDVTILELAQAVKEVIGYDGKMIHDLSKPDGTMRKLMDSSNLRSLGWEPKVHLKEGLTMAYSWFKENVV